MTIAVYRQSGFRQRPANWRSVLVRRFSASEGTLISALLASKNKAEMCQPLHEVLMTCTVVLPTAREF